MRYKSTLLISLLLLSAAMPLATHAQRAGDAEELARGNAWMRTSASLFEENKGQVSGDDAAKVRYTYTDGPLNIFLLDDGLAYQFNRMHYPEGFRWPDKYSEEAEETLMRALRDEVRVETYRMDMTLMGADPNAKVTATGRSQDYTHYYDREALDVHRYSTITYHAVYPHIDWVIYCGADGRGVKYDFVVHPGGDPQQIAFTARWVEGLKLGADGSLMLANRMGSITERTPVSFQGGREIGTSFRVEHDRISFQVEAYDPHETLIIDPSLIWSTYYGGNDYDHGNASAVDADGNVFLAGRANSNTNIGAGGHMNNNPSGGSAFLVKFNASGVRQWGTYYGGGNQDWGYACAVDALGNCYLTGETGSPSQVATAGAHLTQRPGFIAAFLVKFNSAGVRQWGTYYGGTGDDFGYGCAVDAANNVYVAGRTSSSTGISENGHQNVNGGGLRDAFLVKFNEDGVRQWGTYYGGPSNDIGHACAVDGAGNVYLAGETVSTSGIASSGHQMTIGGGSGDAFLAKFDGNGVRQWGTYYGGSAIDRGFGCAADALGNSYLTGETSSSTMIAAIGHQVTYGSGKDAFLVKFNPTGSRLWGTYYGGLGVDEGHACRVDGSGNVYLAGMTTSTNAIAQDGHQNTYGGNGDGFVAKFNGAGTRQWATYFGGANEELGEGCAVDPAGSVYLVGQTLSNSGITSGGHQNNYGGGYSDAFLVKFEGGSAPACIPTIAITSDPGTTICQGQEVVFTATVTNEGMAPVYQWKRNGTNVGSNAATYVSTSDSDGDVITCELSSNAPCADPAAVLSNALTMNVVTVDDGVALDGATLTATQTDAAYQWLDCNSGFALIAGQTDQSYSPAQNGNYAVEVTVGDCPVQSECVEVLTTSVQEMMEQGTLRVYPVPASDHVVIEGTVANAYLELLDAQGRVVRSMGTNSDRSVLELGGVAAGSYLLRMQSPNGQQVVRLLVQ